MIPGSPPARQRNPWRAEFADAVTDGAELLRLLDLEHRSELLSERARRDFALRVPLSFVRRMRPGDPDDPLLRQVLPATAECLPQPGFSTDPLAEADAMPVPGLLHKYPGRVLLTLTGACAVNCRYCFRRHFPYPDANPAHAHWQAALDYLRADPGIAEVILSGGDPLMVGDERLAAMTAQLADIPQLQRLRIHTRLPVVIPSRVGETLVQALTGTRLKPVIVLHVNHPNEIDADFAGAVARLSGAGIALLNQSVLLAGVNDTADALAALSERLFAIGVLPYYLHQLDPVLGAAHFGVDDERARALVEALKQRLAGYLVPRLVRELAGAASKVAL